MTLEIHRTTGQFTDYDIRAKADGEAGEHRLIQVLRDAGDGNTFTIEVKTDRRAAETGNVYIELKVAGKPSGILTTKATWFVIVTDDGDAMYTYRTAPFRDFIRHMANACWTADDGRYGNARLSSTNKDQARPSVGLLYPLQWLAMDFLAYQRAPEYLNATAA